MICLVILSSGWIYSCNKQKVNIPDCQNSITALITDKDTLNSDFTNFAIQIADSLLNILTLEERIGQTIMPSISSRADEFSIREYRRMIEDYHIGGIVLLEGDVESARKLSEIGSMAKIPLFVSIDAEWGLGMRLKEASSYPRNGRISKDADDNLLYDYGRTVAKECRNIGINMVLGPVVDISGLYEGIIKSRSFGSDPKKVSEYGVAYAKGLESERVISVAKHFPGHGSSVIDSHKGVAKVNKSITELDSIDLLPFRQYIKSGLSGIMVGHISVPSLSPDGIPAAVSNDILTDLLRGEMGFKGLVITDAFNMGGANGFSASQALSAGADIVLSPKDISKEIKEIIDLIESGEMDPQIINERCRRILFVKALFLIVNDFQNDFSQVDEVTQGYFAVYNAISQKPVENLTEASIEKLDMDFYTALIYDTDKGILYIYNFSKS